MNIMDFIRPDAICVDLRAKDKASAIRELVTLLRQTGAITDEESLVVKLLEREALGSTGIGQGVGIPHGKSTSVRSLVGAFGLSRRGIPFDALDAEPVYLVFLLVAPEDSAGPHLKALAKISRLLKDKFLRTTLRAATTIDDVVHILSREDERA